MEKPNTLFTTADEQHFDEMGYRNGKAAAPDLGKLQKSSVDFAKAYTSSLSCVPTKTAVFTGRCPSRYGVPGYMTALPERETTFVSLLQEGGYHIAIVGKQHFWNSRIIRGYGHEDIVDEHEPPEVISSEVGEGYFGLPANKTTTLAVSSHVKYLYDHGLRRKRGLHRQVNEKRIYEFLGDERLYMDIYIGNRGLERLEKRRLEYRPRFLTLSFSGPHVPFDGLGLPDPSAYETGDLSMSDTTAADLFRRPPHYLDIVKKYGRVDLAGHGSPDRFTRDEIQLMEKVYYSNTTLIDRKIGEVTKKLKELQLYDNTMIMFASDHGDFMGDFGVASKAQYSSRALMRVPFLLKPSVSGLKGYKEPSPTNPVEIATTCLTMAKLSMSSRIQDQNLTCFFDKKNLVPKETIVYIEAGGIRAIRDDRYKLAYYVGHSYGELYDLRVNLVKKYSLWNEPLSQQEKNRLMDLLMGKIINLGGNMDVK